MAMTNAGRSAAIKDAIISAFGAPVDDAKLQKFCDAFAQGDTDYIKTHAEVDSTGADPQGGTVTSTGTIS